MNSVSQKAPSRLELAATLHSSTGQSPYTISSIMMK